MEYDLLENREFEDWLVKLRREFHRYPEPGWLEYRTTVRIIEELEQIGIPVIWGRDLYAADCRLGLPEPEEDRAAVRRAIEETKRGIYRSYGRDRREADGSCRGYPGGH